MKKLALACVILVSVVSVSLGELSDEEWNRNYANCAEVSYGTPTSESKSDKNACEALINHSLELGWGRLENCNKDNCESMGYFYDFAERYREAIPYFEKAIALGVPTFTSLGNAYHQIGDYYNAKKYFEIGCGKANDNVNNNIIKNNHITSCHNLAGIYAKGEGVRQDYAKARELYKKACDLKYGYSCSALGSLYETGDGVRQNLSTAKQYYGKGCDLGSQIGCDDYKRLNEIGF